MGNSHEVGRAAQAGETADVAQLKRALIAIKDLRAKLEASERTRHEPIAIVGIGCRFPGGVETPADFWSLLENGRDAIGPVPASRWDTQAYYDPDPDAPGKTSMHSGGFLSGPIDGFDAPFFNIAPREAVRLDPQQRLLLEVSWEALEHAGIAPGSLAGGEAGVFFGLSTSDYKELELRRDDITQIDPYVGTGGSACVAAGRVSYFLGLHGPAMAVDTACSSSLVAIDLAVQSLRAGRCPVALAGGVNLMLVPEAAVYLSKVRALSADGRCKAFDAAADGYGRGEGCGVVVLKRLSDAVADGNRVIAVIRGSAVNHDGRSSGLTVPNGAAQRAVIEQALVNARLEPADVAYIEAHGTGTPLGDPIELRALGAVLGRNRPADQPLLVGTAKTNIGHLEAAAGVAGLIKLALSLANDFVPPSLHLNTPSPHIPWQELPIDVPTEGRRWPAAAKRIAGVSSFGFSGTNAHVILEAAPAQAATAAPAATVRPVHVLPLSARNAESLRLLAERYGSALSDDAPIADVCFTAASGRAHFEERLAVCASTTVDLKSALRTYFEAGAAPGVKRGRLHGRAPRVAFLFTGQGCQYPGMGKQLYETQPVFRAALDECARAFEGELQTPLLDVINSEGDEGRARLTQTGYAQPAIFAIEYALAQLWKSWGIEPAAVIGHSVGEFAAACVAGILSLPDAVRLVAARGRLMQSLPPGGRMAAIFAGEQCVAEAVAASAGRIAIAAVNGPEHYVISGPGPDVDAVVERVRAGGVRVEALNVSHAFHSSLMDPILDEFERVASTVRYAKPRIKFISNLTGAVASDLLTTPRYWRDHLREPVRFADGIRALSSLGIDLFVEAGPHPVLCGLTAATLPAGAATCLPTLRRGRSDWTQVVDAAAELYARGASIDWQAFDGCGQRAPITLPTYAFDRQRFWIDQVPSKRQSPAPATLTQSLAGERVRSPLSSDLVFQAEMSASSVPFIADHVIYGDVLFPAAGLVELALSAGAAAFGTRVASVGRFTIQQPLPLAEGQPRTVQTVLTQPADGVSRFTIYSTGAADAESPWLLHASGELRLDAAPQPAPIPEIDAARNRCGQPLDAAEFYAKLSAAGIDFGPSFRGIEQLWEGEGEAVARVSPVAAGRSAGQFVVHPALLDTCFQMLGAACGSRGELGADDVFLPVGIDDLQVLGAPDGQAFWGYASLRRQESGSAQTITADLWWLDDQGRPLLRIEGFTAQRASRSAMQRAGRRDVDRCLLEIDWLPVERAAASADAPRKWILLADDIRAGRELAAKLRSDAADAMLVVPESAQDGVPADEDTYVVDTFSRQSLAAVFQGLVPGGASCGVVHLSTGVAETAAVQQTCGSLLATAQALATTGVSGARLWVVTISAQAVQAGDVATPAHTATWGLAQAVAAEYPALGAVRIDLEDASSGQLDLLVDELRGARAEDQVALRGDRCFVSRLVRRGEAKGRPRLVPPASECWRLAIPKKGTIDDLQFETVDRKAPDAGEIEVRVHSTGLNFRDVLNVLAMYPGEAGPLGSECAGVVTRVGEGVTAFAPGDEVMCMGGGSFRPFFTVSAGLVMRKPAELTFEQASGVPIACLTAAYGLENLGRMKAGDRVLIHAAAGGVGLAAVQLALRAGAEVFGTAGSPAKRRLLRDLGVHHVLSSRTLDFSDEIRTITDGRGVDIVLNSLAGEFIPRSLALLAPGGRFVEIGKAEILDAPRAAAINPQAQYFAFDLGEVVLADQRLADRLYADLLARLADGSLRPLPVRVFGIDEAPAAFRYMAQARHIGKVVVSQPEARIEHGGDGPLFRENAAYLVTGGLGALGLSVARWMVERGARHLVLAGRSTPPPDARAEMAALEGNGARVHVVAADVSTEAGVREMLRTATLTGVPLRGVIHAAGVLDDGVLADQDWSRVARVLAPKVSGSALLDRLTREHPIEHFVLFSSVAAVIASAGQGAYAAANAFMDGLAWQRRAAGLPAQTINWGPWGERGMAAGLSQAERDRMRATGFEMLPTARALAALERSIRLNPPRVAVMQARWDVVCGRFPASQVPPLMRLLAAESAGATPSGAAVAGPDSSTAAAGRLAWAEIVAAEPHARTPLVERLVCGEVCRVVGLGASAAVAVDTEWNSLGMDSLMAVELKNRIEAATGLPLAIGDLLRAGSAGALAQLILAAAPAKGAPEADNALVGAGAGAIEEGEL